MNKHLRKKLVKYLLINPLKLIISVSLSTILFLMFLYFITTPFIIYVYCKYGIFEEYIISALVFFIVGVIMFANIDSEDIKLEKETWIENLLKRF